MENSMALWLPLSAAYLVFMAVMIARAVRHFRRQRGYREVTIAPLEAHAPEPRRAFTPPRRIPGADTGARDWSPAR